MGLLGPRYHATKHPAWCEVANDPIPAHVSELRKLPAERGVVISTFKKERNDGKTTT
jgi:hypothetical protein